MRHAWERGETCRGFWRESAKEKTLGRPRRRWEDGNTIDFREICWGVWSGFTWLRTGTVGGLLWMRWWTFRFWYRGVSFCFHCAVPIEQWTLGISVKLEKNCIRARRPMKRIVVSKHTFTVWSGRRKCWGRQRKRCTEQVHWCWWSRDRDVHPMSVTSDDNSIFISVLTMH
jgi:hypothetical protein